MPMHQFIATLFSLLVALCHHSSLTARPVEAAEVPGAAEHSPTLSSAGMVLPDRYQFARSANAEASYAETACLSCRRLDTYSVER